MDQGQPYINVLEPFSQVVDTCFGVSLLPEYQTHIEDFKANYLSLGLSVTPKVKYYFKKIVSISYYCQVHRVFQHVSEYLKSVNMNTISPPLKGL